MKNSELLDIYRDDLISAFGQTTATRLAGLLRGRVSHDNIHRLLAQAASRAADLWPIVKPYGRQIEQADGVIIINDSSAEKPYSDENDIICWHYDPSQDRSVKGIKFVTWRYHASGYSLPVGFSIVAKTHDFLAKKDGKPKRRSPISKNELYRALLSNAKRNQIAFQYVLSDVWYSAAENMRFIKHDLNKDFIMPLNSNRNVALSAATKRAGQWLRLDQLTLEANTPLEIDLENVDFPLLLVKQVFAKEAGSTGIHYLVSSDTSLTGEGMIIIYPKRWNVKPYPKSLKQNASLEKSPTQPVTTQTNRLLASLCAYIKLEWLRKTTTLNHFALKTKRYGVALHSALDILRQFQPILLSA
jgi:hypothetical protein